MFSIVRRVASRIKLVKIVDEEVKNRAYGYFSIRKLHYTQNNMIGDKKSYLIWFANEHLEFRLAELESLMVMFNVELEFVTLEKPFENRVHISTDDLTLPWLVVRADNEQGLRKVCSRSILIKHVVELMAEGESLPEVVEKLRNSDLTEHHDTFRFEVEAFGKRKIQRPEKISKMEMFHFLPFKGSIDLNSPQHVYHIIEFYGMDNHMKAPDDPHSVFFGRLIAEGQRELVAKLSLKTRKFIANTSMDPTLSIIMSNMIQTKCNDIVYDPFVGSGSLLVAAAHHGGYVFGLDIDYLLLHGRAKPSRCNEKVRSENESVYENLCQYKIEDRYLGIVVADSSLPVLRRMAIDAVVTDPPYGIRESTERIGTKKSNYTVPGHLAEKHIPSKVSYNLREVVHDLVTFSVNHLPVGRRLNFWMPVYRSDFLEDVDAALPKHPCLQLVAASEQRLTSHSSRLLLTLQKIKEPSEGDALVSNISPSHGQDFRLKYFAKHEDKLSGEFKQK